MRKILIYISSLKQGGGAERMASYLANYLSEKKYEVSIVTDIKEKSEYWIEDKIKRFVMKAFPSDNAVKKNYVQVKSLRKLCKKEKPDICISFLPEADFRLLAAKAGLHIPLVFSVRSNPRVKYKSFVYHFLAVIFYGFANGAVFQTKEAMEYFSPGIQKKGVVIPNPVPKEFLEYPVNKEHKNIVSVGRLTGVKNYDLLIEAFALISDEYKDENLILYGEGELRGHLEEKIKKKGLENRIKLPGNVPAIEKELAKARLFILSSNSEGMPNALMEAMAIGCPVISTDCPSGGPGALISNEENGLLIKVNDMEGLAGAIKKVLNNPILEMKLRENSRKSMEKYEKSQICCQWENFLKEIVSLKQDNDCKKEK